MRTAFTWVKANWRKTVVAAAILLFVYVYFWPSDLWPKGQRHSHLVVLDLPGTVEHPASMQNESSQWFREPEAYSSASWRSTILWDLMEAPLANGYTVGRCFVTTGRVRDGYPDRAPDDNTSLFIEYAANGIILETGDADLACNAPAIESAITGAYGNPLPLEEVAVASEEHPDSPRYFVHVTYITEDVDPDVVVVTNVETKAGDRVPERSNVIAFQRVKPDGSYYSDAWCDIFGIDHHEEAGA